jgi:ribokinase
LLHGLFLLTPNEPETLALTGIDPSDEGACREAVSVLHDRGVSNVVLTLGSRGCFVSDSRRSQSFDAFRVQAIDTTAAGDAFSGSIAHFLAQGRDLWNAAQLANMVGALSTTVKGAQTSMPTYGMLQAAARNSL